MESERCSDGDANPNSKPPVVEGFSFQGQLGHGATSTVWKAEQTSLGRTVVIKLLDETLSRDREDVERFKSEARIAAKLKHPGIVQVYDFGQAVDTRRYYVVMEYISGYTLGDWLRRKGRLSESDAIVVAHSVAAALHYAWENSKLVHCDIKPENIMVDGDGTIKVTDLGLAQTLGIRAGQSTSSQDVIIMGTPNYMPPEQVRGEKMLDCRSDMYALGATMHHVITGQVPFGLLDPEAVMNLQLKQDLPNVCAVVPSMSVGLASLIARMLEKDRALRHQSWLAIIEDLQELDKARQSKKNEAAKTGALAEEDKQDEFKRCPFCAEPIRKEAVYCRYCKQSIEPARKSAKPDAAPSPTTGRAKPGAITPGPIANPSSRTAAVRAAMAAAPAMASLKTDDEPSGVWRFIRGFSSILVLLFLAVWGFYKVVYNRDIIAPIKIKIAKTFDPEWQEAGQAIKDEDQRNRDRTALIKSSKKKVTRKVLNPASSESKEDPTAIRESDNSSRSLTDTDVRRALWAPEATPAAQSEAERSASEFISPAPQKGEATAAGAPPSTPSDKVIASPMMTARREKQPPIGLLSKGPAPDAGLLDYIRVCRRDQPKVGDVVAVKLKSQAKSVEGKLVSIRPDGVELQLAGGVVAYPFNLLHEDSRLQFFPEERARILYQNSKSKR